MFRAAFVPAAAVAVLIVGAPSAAAVPVYQTATSLAISGTVGVGCTVTLTATVTSTPPPIDAGQVRFYLDDSVDLGQPTLKSGKASVTWTPIAAQAGSHELVAFYTGFNNNDQEAWTSSGARVVVNVANAINLGSACVPF
ncbi:Ig-like domain-containing protein [Antrihabitans stalactiti]|uniref:Ig-like domain repeat protein n=1 Tax=Antrihabitans stalactiti TaxID=2584121 RepID=A0A848KIQ4_9NOCA|nr:Ig-like domain-containing protein [Antrihabitans stalactiti]NMN95767.1 Ig-like domain repeat protein [Antrihabitans stalactiti]